MSAGLNCARAQLAAKVESTEGTAETLTASEGTFKVWDVDIDYDVPFVRDESVQSSLSPRSGIVSGPRLAKLTFKTWFVGSGTKDTEPTWTTLCKGCAVTVAVNAGTSVVLTPDDDMGNSLTIGWYVDGTYHQLHGARGDWKITGKAGQPMVNEWAFTGIYNARSDVALLTSPSYQTTVAPSWYSSTLTIDSVAVKLSDFTFALNNNVQMVDTVNTSTAAYAAGIFGKRHCTATANILATVVATKNWYTNWTGNTLQAISFNLGSTTGNQWAFSYPKAQISKIKPENRNDMFRDALEFELIQNSGSDEFSFTQT